MNKLTKILIYILFFILAIIISRLTYVWRWTGVDIINAMCGGQEYGFPFVFKSYSEPGIAYCLGFSSGEPILRLLSNILNIFFWFMVFNSLEFFVRHLNAKSNRK